MMRLSNLLIKLLWFLILLCVPFFAIAKNPIILQIPRGHFAALSFHDVRDGIKPFVSPDPYVISTDRLAKFFDWIKQHNWHPISIQQIIDAHNGVKPLPSNAVLLTFDDGLESVYTKVFPLLQAYHYPAVLSIETGWLERVHGGGQAQYNNERISLSYDELKAGRSSNLRVPGKVLYDDRELGASSFVTWWQLREMQASGLVEIASHSNHLHHGILANPQGNMEPAAITRLYNKETGTYESPSQYHKRIHDDLKRSIDIIQSRTGRRPRVIVWPYGAMNRDVIQIAESLGLKLSFSLYDYHVASPKDLGNLGRFIIYHDPTPVQIESQIAEAVIPKPQVERAIQVDLDYIYDPDPAQVNRNLSKLLDRIKAMKIRSVYLQAYADPDGDGTASELYFPNHYLPMRADLFNRVAWQLTTRADVVVYAWLPLLAFDLPNTSLQHRLAVKVYGKNGKVHLSPHDFRRLSPFLPKSLQIVKGIYKDLVINTPSIRGILISDDAYLTADEDASSCEPQARWPNGAYITKCHLSPRQKTNALIDFSHQAVAVMKQYNNLSNHFFVTRNLYARVVMDPSSEARFSQALGPFLANYHQVALMAMPYLDETKKPPMKWLNQLAAKVALYPYGLRKVVFELQARDWKKQKWINAVILRYWMYGLIRDKAVNLAYYPDDFLNNKPRFRPTFEGISLSNFPYWEWERRK